MKSSRFLILIIAVFLVLAIVFGYQRSIPRILSYSPADTATGILEYTPIQIEFSHQMDSSSVEEFLQIEPSTTGSFAWTNSQLTFTPDTPWPQGTTISVSLSSQARSMLGLSLQQDVTWSFTIGRTLLAYLYPADGPADLYALDIISGEIKRFTNSAGVLDFDVDIAGTKIYYSAVNQEGGSNLYMYDRTLESSSLILDCAVTLCRNPQIHPDLPVLAYQRISSNNQAEHAATEVWILSDISDPQSNSVVANGDTASPLWSATGWLSYYSYQLNKYAFLNYETGEQKFFNNQSGIQGDWLPSGTVFIAPQRIVSQSPSTQTSSPDSESDPTATPNVDQVYLPSHLMSYDLETGRVTNLTKDLFLEDASPSASNNGRLIAFGRKYIDQNRWTPGRQLWIMSADSGQAIMLTEAFDYIHSNFAWHPDGRTIAFVRFNQTLLLDPPELWVIDRDGRNAIQLIIGGFSPQWIP